MWLDVVDLKNFYNSVLGKNAQKLVAQSIRMVWPNVNTQSVMGLGYAIPFLDIFQKEAERTIAVMPARQGILHWPEKKMGRITLCDEGRIPLPDSYFDKILLVHAFECTEKLRPMLREVWRVLGEEGSLMVVVPNRTGIWARMDHTPFGYGNPYTPAQAKRLLRETLFTPTRTERALFIPPMSHALMMASAPAMEKIGKGLFPSLGGALIIECKKQIHAPTISKETSRSRRPHYKIVTPN
ncbi:MAG: methyltransferase type 11 [Rhodospirillaceae bacterium]|nr:methyltransferase type 11 [Rhodospirillaceae bacterium]